MLVLAASQCRVAWVVLSLGIITLLKGLTIVTLRLEKTKSRLSWWGDRSPMATRFLALIAICIGGLLLYSI